MPRTVVVLQKESLMQEKNVGHFLVCQVYSSSRKYNNFYKNHITFNRVHDYRQQAFLIVLLKRNREIFGLGGSTFYVFMEARCGSSVCFKLKQALPKSSKQRKSVL